MLHWLKRAFLYFWQCLFQTLFPENPPLTRPTFNKNVDPEQSLIHKLHEKTPDNHDI